MPNRHRPSIKAPTVQDILNIMPAVVFFCDNDELYTMRFISPNLRDFMGYVADEFIDNRKHFAASTVHPDDLDVVDEFAERASASATPIGARYRLVRANGEVFQALVVSRAVNDPQSGKMVGFCGAITDLSHMPSLQGKSCVLSDPRPARTPPAPKQSKKGKR